MWHANNISSDRCREILLHAGVPPNYGMIESPIMLNNVLAVDPNAKSNKKNLQSPHWPQFNDVFDEQLMPRFRTTDQYNFRPPNYRHGTQGDNFDADSTSAI